MMLTSLQRLAKLVPRDDQLYLRGQGLIASNAALCSLATNCIQKSTSAIGAAYNLHSISRRRKGRRVGKGEWFGASCSSS